jgi:hypothetical protein
VVQFKKLVATVHQQGQSIKQLTQRIDTQEEMLIKAREEIEILQLGNKNNSTMQKLLPPSSLALANDEVTVEMAADDPSVNSNGNSRDDSSSSSSWAQLEISPNIVGSVRYANFRINIYQHARNTKIEKEKEQSNRHCSSSEVEYKKFYYVPVAMLTAAAPVASLTTSLDALK